MSENKTKDRIKIILLKQSAIQSIISDIVNFGLVGLLFWFYYQSIGDNYVVSLIILILIIAKIIAFGRVKTRYTIQEAREYLDELEADE